ncbi:MAG: hypothetical protein ACRDT2_19925 [Natronosporangium sp.]
MAYLDTVFLVGRASAWGTNLSTKAAKTPKTYVTDSGLPPICSMSTRGHCPGSAIRRWAVRWKRSCTTS